MMRRENQGPSVATVGLEGRARGTGDARTSCHDDEGKKNAHVLTNL